MAPGHPGGVGRPSRLTIELIQAIERAVDASGAIQILNDAGIPRRTHQNWRSLGRRGVDPYKQFLAALAVHGLDRRYAF